MEEIKEFIKMKKRETLKIGIQDENGEPKKDKNGNVVYIEFDLEDIELPLKYNKCEFLIRKAQQDFKFRNIAIEKREDVKTNKMLLSKNEEDKIKSLRQFYDDMVEAMDLFLGKGGVQKIFGDLRYIEMFDDLNEMLQPILPMLKVNMESIQNKIIDKYKPKETDVLSND